MKKAINKNIVLAIVLTIAMVLGTSTIAFASNSYPYPLGGSALLTTTSYQTIATSSTGFNCKVTIYNLNSQACRSDVKMLGKTGNVVWEETGALPASGQREFSCGSDVYTIQVKTQSGKGSANAWQSGSL